MPMTIDEIMKWDHNRFQDFGERKVIPKFCILFN